MEFKRCTPNRIDIQKSRRVNLYDRLVIDDAEGIVRGAESVARAISLFAVGSKLDCDIPARQTDAVMVISPLSEIRDRLALGEAS